MLGQVENSKQQLNYQEQILDGRLNEFKGRKRIQISKMLRFTFKTIDIQGFTCIWPSVHSFTYPFIVYSSLSAYCKTGSVLVI